MMNNFNTKIRHLAGMNENFVLLSSTGRLPQVKELTNNVTQ